MRSNLEGRRFGRWLCLEFAGIYGHGRARQSLWLCKCDCGTERTVIRGSLQSGDSKSCGCLKVEVLRALSRGNQYRRKYGSSAESALAKKRTTAEWAARNRNKVRSSANAYRQRSVDQLSDYYVRTILEREMMVSRKLLPPELVEARRIQIQIRRHLKEIDDGPQSSY